MGALYILSFDPKKEVGRRVLLPREGGEIFVCSDSRCGGSGGLHADLNAAANIGIRAMMDGRWPGSWRYLPMTASGLYLKAFALKGAPESLKAMRFEPEGGTDTVKPARKDKDGVEAVFNGFLTKGPERNGFRWKPWQRFRQEALASVCGHLQSRYRCG